MDGCGRSAIGAGAGLKRFVLMARVVGLWQMRHGDRSVNPVTSINQPLNPPRFWVKSRFPDLGGGFRRKSSL